MILLQHGLDPNVRFSQRTQHILLSLMDMVSNARSPADLDHVYALTVTLLQYRADPNVHIATTEPMICHSQSSVFLKKSSHQVLYHYVQVRRPPLSQPFLFCSFSSNRIVFTIEWILVHCWSISNRFLDF